MHALTKLALGMMGRLHPQPAVGESTKTIVLPSAQMAGGLPLMEALSKRQSQRDFAPDALPLPVLSDLLWSAAGINRPDLGGRTAPSAMNSQEVVLYAALSDGLYCYDPAAHLLRLVVAADVRRVSGYQDFVDTAPLDLIFVADHTRMKLVPAAQRDAYAFAAAGAMAQNVYLYCASSGLAAVLRAWFDRRALGEAMHLSTDQQLLLVQTVGRPRAAEPTA